MQSHAGPAVPKLVAPATRQHCRSHPDCRRHARGSNSLATRRCSQTPAREPLWRCRARLAAPGCLISGESRSQARPSTMRSSMAGEPRTSPALQQWPKTWMRKNWTSGRPLWPGERRPASLSGLWGAPAGLAGPSSAWQCIGRLWSARRAGPGPQQAANAAGGGGGGGSRRPSACCCSHLPQQAAAHTCCSPLRPAAASWRPTQHPSR